MKIDLQYNYEKYMKYINRRELITLCYYKERTTYEY